MAVREGSDKKSRMTATMSATAHMPFVSDVSFDGRSRAFHRGPVAGPMVRDCASRHYLGLTSAMLATS